jgi:hypothetical protein
MVISRSSDIIDIASPQALLTSRGSGELEFDFAEKMILELVHPGRREENRGVPSRHQNIAGLAMVAFRLKEAQILFTQFVGFHGDLGFRQFEWLCPTDRIRDYIDCSEPS